MRLVLVVAVALVDVDDRVLIAQRPEGKPLAGLWEFPGGKIEPGECPEDAVIRADGLELDLAARVVRRDGEEVHLTPTEFDLLRLLARNRGRLMTHRELLLSVWGAGYSDDTQVLRAHIANLRRKIEPTSGPRYIRTDPGVGYRFAA